MKPGSSAKLTSGKWKTSQSCMRRITLLPPATSVEPPWKRGSFAITPTG